ncbi:MAG: hypothetical protein HRU50_07195 [Winogradskyella sp.]|uniref:hypothetical protein n=1 Tax=Winogradskyella sp. TaxID=1883156 RepID=UPI0025D7793A|nr:hypothetical protein [Winogradskyella sp.]NRB59718.1 hypothetical protein [Winogradskyella sp.]
MKKIALHILLAFQLAVLISCSSDDTNSNTIVITGEVSSVNTFGGSNNDSGQSVVATNDGGYAILGYTQSNDGDILDKQDESFDFWVLKFDVNDSIQWQKTFGGSGDDRGRSIIQTDDGGYAVIGYTTSSDGDITSNSGLRDYWLLKLNANGNISWQKSYGFMGNDSGISVIQTMDQGYVISGILDVTASGGAGNTSRTYNNSNIRSKHAGGDYWIIKLDNSGNLDWSQYFGGNFTDTPNGVVETENGDFIIAGSSDSTDTNISNNLGTYDFWVIKISSNGDLMWEKSYGGDQIDEARGIVKTSNNNYIIVGDTRSDNTNVGANNGAADLWLIKINTLGDLIWEKSIGGSSFDVARAITRSQNDGFILAGSSRSNDIDVSENKGQNDAWVLKVDDNGNLAWETTIGGSNIDFAYSVAELNNQTIVAVGDTVSNDGDILSNKGFTDLLMIKIE